MEQFIENLFLGEIVAGSVKAWLFFGLSLILYFLVEFKTKSEKEGFSLGFWIQDNWYNVIISVVLALMYNMGNAMVISGMLLVIAFGGNWLIDAIVTYIHYKRHGKSG